MSDINELKAYIELDREIKKRVENAYKLKNETKVKIGKQKKDIENTMWEENKKHIEEEKKNLDASIILAQNENATTLKEMQKALEIKFNENKEKWIDEIVNHCIGE